MPPAMPPSNRALALSYRRVLARAAGWFELVDPGVHRRIKGLRLVTAYSLAAMLGTTPEISRAVPNASLLSSLAAGFSLWASVSEAQTTRMKSTRDLLALNVAAVIGAAMMIGLGPIVGRATGLGAEVILVSGAFLAGYLKGFGISGAGIGSQIYIGQLLAYGAGLRSSDLRTVAIAGMIGALASIVPRVLSGPAERPAILSEVSPVAGSGGLSPALRMGLQASLAALVIVLLNARIHLVESAWAVTASTYVVAGSAIGTIDRVRRRIIGTIFGVPLALACLPLAVQVPILVWIAAAIAMIIYAMALPNRYDIACGAYAFTLLVTLALTGEHSLSLLIARAWETVIGGVLGTVAAISLAPRHRMAVPS